jgi:hypothetical protein
MMFAGQVAGFPAVCGVDSMSSYCFISPAWCKRAQLAVSPADGTPILLANGASMPALGRCRVPVSIGKYQGHVSCVVADLAANWDLLLGDDWLRQRKGKLCYETKTCTVSKGGQRIELHAAAPPADAAPPLVTLCSALAMKRALRHDAEETFLVLVSPTAPAPAPAFAAAAAAGDACPAGETVPDPDLMPAAELARALQEFSDVFPDELPAGLPPDRDTGHTIKEMPNSTPPFKQVYRLSRAEHLEVEQQIADLLAKGFIEPAATPYGAPILFVRKKTGEMRMCIDYRALNAQTVKDRWPLPRIDELLDQLNGATVFSSLDLASGYHQIRISDEDVPKTGFRTPLGQYVWRVLPFGLTNAPSSFQRCMQKVFQGYIGQFVLVYLDDILVYSRSAADHAKHLRLVLERLRQWKLYAKLKKCSFNQPETEFLGHVVGRNGIRPDPKKVAAVQDWPVPTDIHQLRSFLGLTNYFRRFIQGYASLTRPLVELTRATVPYAWGEAQQRAFEQVKFCLLSAPVLVMPDWSKPFTVTCDASGFASGAVLMQDGHPVAYASRKFNEAEVRKSPYERELLAAYQALLDWRCYLDGSQFTIVSDHNPLKYLQSQQQLSSKQARIAEYLERFHYSWEFIPGRINVADPLSRRPDHAAPALAAPALTRAGARTQGGRDDASHAAPVKHLPRDATAALPVKHLPQGISASLPLPPPPSATPPPAAPAKHLPRDATAAPPAKHLPQAPTAQPPAAVGTAGRKRQAAPTSPASKRPRADPPEQAPAQPQRRRRGKRRRTASAQQDVTTPLAAPTLAEDLLERIGTAQGTDTHFAENAATYRLTQKNELWYKDHAVVVPDDRTLRRDCISAVHDPPFSGHLGVSKTVHQASRVFWWPTMNKDVLHYVQTCPHCQHNKTSTLPPAGLLQPLGVPGRRWEDVTMDFITGLPATANGYDSIVVFVDRLSKMVHFKPCTAKTDTLAAARLLLHAVVQYHGVPRRIISDRGLCLSPSLCLSCGVSCTA